MPAYVYIHTSSQLGQENDRRKLEKHPQVVDFYQTPALSINIVPCRRKTGTTLLSITGIV